MTGFSRRPQTLAVCLVLSCYACARALQVVTGPTPRLSLVALEVVLALAFAMVDGSRTLGVRGILTFAAICAVIGNVVENVGVATGFPFGHYAFTDVMGPKLFSVPILLGLAYVGMAYVSWALARTILGGAGGVTGKPVFAVAALASFIMVAWDLAQDPVWSTMLRAWVWRDGGPWFGVPLSNFFGWFLTVFAIYLVFAFFVARAPEGVADDCGWPAIAFYALCAGGNVLQLATRRNALLVQDGSGHSWRVSDILAASAIVSVLVMGSFAGLAAVRTMSYRKTATG